MSGQLGRGVWRLLGCRQVGWRSVELLPPVIIISARSLASRDSHSDKVDIGDASRHSPQKTKELKDLLAELYSEQKQKETLPSAGGFSEYRDEDAPVIYDVEEERMLLRKAYEEGRELVLERDQKRPTVRRHAELLQGRGPRGVLSLQELTAILQRERVLDLAVIKVPAERQYADHLIIGTGRNARHLMAVSQLVQRLFKDQRLGTDPVPHIEGEQTKGQTGWIAMDMGNVVLHLFTQEMREVYDLETLWTVGGEYDDLSREARRPTSLQQLMLTQLEEFQPLDEEDSAAAAAAAAEEPELLDSVSHLQLDQAAAGRK